MNQSINRNVSSWLWVEGVGKGGKGKIKEGCEGKILKMQEIHFSNVYCMLVYCILFHMQERGKIGNGTTRKGINTKKREKWSFKREREMRFPKILTHKR